MKFNQKLGILVLASTLLMHVSGNAALRARWAPPKPEHTVLSNEYHRYCINVKFAEGNAVRLRDGKLVSSDSNVLSSFHEVYEQYEIKKLSRLFSRPEHILDTERVKGQVNSGKELADLNNYFRVILDSSANSEQFINDLNRLDIIEMACAEPRYFVDYDDIPPETPDLTEHQGYLYDAPEGINAPAAWELPGGTGEGVRIIDMEINIYLSDHEDLSQPFYVTPDGARFGGHATSSVGILNAGHNGYGLDGICPDAEIGSFAMEPHPHDFPNLADQINVMADTLDIGGIIVVVAGYRIEGGLGLIELQAGIFDAIENASANGIIFVEAAGNDFSDLDRLMRNRHSGAIFVGAGAPPSGNWGPDRSRLEFSNYGQRVDLQGWGEEVTTTAGGGLWVGNNDPRQTYWADHNGTSSATPIVAGAVACIQGIVKARSRGRMVLNSTEMRDLLVETGSPQQDGPNGNGHIGPRPNLAEAIEHIPFPSGVLYGTVIDFETDETIPFAQITTLFGDEAICDDVGEWVMPNSLAFGDFTLTVQAEDFLNQTVEVHLEEGDSLEVNISLLYSGFNLSAESFNIDIEPESLIELPISITNNGNGTLVWQAEKRIPSLEDLQQWDMMDSLPIGETLENGSLHGVALIGDFFYTTGYRNNSFLYKLNRDGELVNRFPRPGNPNSKMRDLAYDGEILWATAGEVAYGFTTEGDSVTGFELETNALTAITWDSNREVLWMSGFVSDAITGYSRDGQVAGSIDGCEFNIHSLTYWAEDPDDCPLYMLHSPDNETHLIHKINPVNGDTLFVSTLRTEAGFRPNGTFISKGWDRYSTVFLTLSSPDQNEILDIRLLADFNEWFDLNTLSGEIEADGTEDLILLLNSDSLDNQEYEGELLFQHNAAGGETSIGITVSVELNNVTDDTNHHPSTFGINSISPNPFNSELHISFNLLQDTFAEMRMFDITGREVKQVLRSHRKTGTHQLTFNSAHLTSGLYFLSLKTSSQHDIKKVICLK
ncbi:MAG: S8 family serine peptidase [Calditrichaeota bacterium]|mgnify:CR=1 FL=1|jgi:serine protease|nr:S8 family serine peptidase [Calditrichota bacterium]MBT7618054.1 S8 family serine peptidase [Calditrichota bacterium]MBT7789385.1 S8 family serine peptidase [Calditrichota bacterium]